MRLELSAWSPEAGFVLDRERAVAMGETKLVDVSPRSDGSWTLSTNSRIGIAQGDGWEVRVSPRLDVPRLMFLLGYATDPKGWKTDTADFSEEADLFEAIANGFAVHAMRAVEPVPLRGYVSFDERAMTLRGRLRVADQIASGKGVPLPLEITYDEFSVNIRENQLLRAAAERLLGFRRVPAMTRTRLRRLRSILGEADPQVVGDLEMPRITRLNRRYSQALALALLILRHSSISSHAGAVRNVAFSFDMNKVFEDFLSAALTDALSRYGGRIKLQHDKTYLATGQKLKLKPDISWWGGGRCRAVIDAKYKRIRDDRFPNADAYQMLAYCTGFDLPEGTLVYAKGEGEESRTYDIEGADKRILVRALDVEAEPAALLAQVEDLAGVIAAARPVLAR